MDTSAETHPHSDQQPVASTSSGPVRGRRQDHGVTAFLGVPFAAPPIGALRFQPPAPPAAWSGVRDATGFGPTAPQAPNPAEGLPLLPNRVAPGDDFLNLNVWTPDLEGDAPVMVFIHGGSFTSGSGSVSVYDGSRFARDGVVLVTINYRLGADGFFWTGDGVPNLGLLDQVAALEWVRDNIRAFGGDPARVTLFGESAGGMSVCALMAMPRATGLFHRAIAESGAGVSVISPESARKVATRLAEILGVAPTRDGIASVPVEALVTASTQVAGEAAKKPRRKLWGDVAKNLMIFEPVVDGDILPGRPEDLIAAGAAHNVELLIGTNADEARLFFVPSGAADTMPGLAANLFAWTFGARRPGTVGRYRRNRPGARKGDVTAAILTDGYYRMPALRLAAAHPHAHVYEFAWQSPAFGGRLGACHAIELPFVFDTLDDPAVAELTGGSAPADLATSVHDAWVRFATTGDPGWAPYTAESRTSMRFDVENRVTVDDRADERALWPKR
ncbi:carboxylesterase [Frondihabitans sp. PAMC 28766]|uniref:carboxylesterase/lipase family protein n=1 Tax=Frondihabitans sp. PAMC 28766 TaxID=1795630 RepID=UPI00078EF67B|nr:carboxylesterase family protein [Frondihabitans sp. PAMC 28766]AMM18899.1 carboxylesterase [Frondihabitans sp. PAMC 28766]